MALKDTLDRFESSLSELVELLTDKGQDDLEQMVEDVVGRTTRKIEAITEYVKGEQAERDDGR